MNILQIQFNIDGVAHHYVGIAANVGDQGGLFLTEDEAEAMLFRDDRYPAQLIQAMQVLKAQGKFDPEKIADYSAVFEGLKLPALLPYNMRRLMRDFDEVLSVAETTPPVQFVLHEVMLVPNRVIAY